MYSSILKSLLLVSLGIGVACSCAFRSPDDQFIRQVIPVEIQRGKPVEIEIHSLSGNGANCVGIRCAPEVWKVLTNSPKAIEVKLKSSSKPQTEIGGIDPNSNAIGFLGYLTNVHYLFYISGEPRTKATVVIIFPNMPEGAAHMEIIVGKTPVDTKL